MKSCCIYDNATYILENIQNVDLPNFNKLPLKG